MAGFKTTVFPMANAGATYLGKFIRKGCMDIIIKYVIAKYITPDRVSIMNIGIVRQGP